MPNFGPNVVLNYREETRIRLEPALLEYQLSADVILRLLRESEPDFWVATLQWGVVGKPTRPTTSTGQNLMIKVVRRGSLTNCRIFIEETGAKNLLEAFFKDWLAVHHVYPTPA